jgi:hypothetical protein
MPAMKNYIWILLIVLFSCKKGSVEMESADIGIDPVGNINALNRALQLKGHFEEGNFPTQTVGAPVQIKLVASQDTIEIGDETRAFIPLSIPDQGFLKLCGMNMKVVGASGYWNVATVNDSVSSDYFVELTIPRMIKPGLIRVVFSAKLCFNGQSIVTDTASVVLSIRPSVPYGSSIKGRNGLTIRKFDMGEKKGKVKIGLITYTIGDRLDVKYNGEYVISTCYSPKKGSYPKCNSPAECFPITDQTYRYFYMNYDPAISRFIEVYVLGYCELPDTEWIVEVGCPE